LHDSRKDRFQGRIAGRIVFREQSGQGYFQRIIPGRFVFPWKAPGKVIIQGSFLEGSFSWEDARQDFFWKRL
jgi:hypothetical protein